MTRFLLQGSLTLTVLLCSACTDDLPLSRAALLFDAGAEPASAASVSAPGAPLPPDCVPVFSPLPRTLSCTGLYGAAGSAAADKAVHPANLGFTPGAALWTDGADKQRWISLPEGRQIDTSKANAWVFPVGTRVWKEFAFQGKRAETRFMYKSEDQWLFATYQWNDTDTEAVSIEHGADIPLRNGGIHSIPTIDQCNQCHRGSTDKLLGFQHVLLGLPDAKGLNLTALAAQNRLSIPPARTSFGIPDDGTGMSAQALSYIHVNCGVSCHNETGNANANMSHMFLRIDPATLDAASTADWNIVKLTVGVPSVTANFFGGTRIVPGFPDKSLIVQLAQTRGSNMAMPPIGTRIVDPAGLATIRAWITRLGGPASDAGSALDGGVSTGMDGAVELVSTATPDAGDSGS
jgi:hypothetical protein